MKINKLIAFTLLETLVALVIIALLIGFVYSSMRLFQEQADLLSQNTVFSEEMARMEHALSSDQQQMPYLYADSCGFTFMAEKNEVNYSLANGKLIRTSFLAGADTFALKTDSLHTWLEGRTVQKGPANAFRFYILHGKEHYPISRMQHYDASQWIHLTDTQHGQ